jgi:hypothetical protein
MSNAVLTSEPEPREGVSPQISQVIQEPRIDPEIMCELERIMESPAFRTSSRCRAFLRHVVLHAHSPEALKERTLGITLFGRMPDYDTGADAIVRVKASEVRRKLGEYAAQADPERNVKIELQPGSYAPRISVRTPEKPVEEQQVMAGGLRKPTHWRRYLVAAIFVVLSLACWLGFAIIRSHSADRRFLRPFLDSDKPILCISHPNAYNLSLNEAHGRGNAKDALRLKDVLSSLGRSSRIGVAQDITAEDLASSPMIIIGGPRFNRWAMNLTQNLRFAFDVVDDEPRIFDRLIPSRYWTDPAIDEATNGSGYVIITRLLATQHQKAVLCIAGLRATDTRAGTKFISDAKTLNGLLKNAPDDWAEKNLQWVLLVQDRGQDQPFVELRAATYW